jgi:DNA-binding transcriptional LysR family regulator
LQLIAGYEHLDLNKREADVAVRIHDKPPETLVGYRLADIAFAVYGVKQLVTRAKRRQSISVVGEDDGREKPKWWPARWEMDERIRTNDPILSCAMIRAGFGVGRLACCIGDLAPELYRLPDPFPIGTTGLWLLTHRDLRRTARIRAFTDFLAEAVRRHRALLEGKQVRSGRVGTRA